MSIIEFPKKENERQEVWVCSCGCCTWYLHSEKSATCAHCGKRIDDPEGVIAHGWGTLDPPPRPADAELPELGNQDPIVIDFNRNDDSFAFLKRRMADGKHLQCVILISTDGHVHTWGGVGEGENRREWLERRFEVARVLLINEQE